MTTTRRRPVIDLLRRKTATARIYWSVRHDTPAELEQKRQRVATYFAEIAMGNRERDAVEAMRAVDLASLEAFASQSLGPIDPRIIGRRSDGSAIFR